MLDQRLKTRVENFISRLRREDVCMHGFILSVGGVGKNLVGIFPGWPQLPTLSSGGWLEENLLRARCFIIGNAPCGVDMLLRFKGDCLTVQSRKSFDPATNSYEGVASGYLKK